jgi:hypothetical protein
MKDTFTIPVSFDEFVAWLNGHARRTKVLPATVMTLPDRTAAIVTAHGAQIAFVLLDDADDRATLRAEIWSSIEPTPEARQWYAETLQAIRLKWPPATDGDDLARKIAREIVREQEWKEIRRRGFIDPAWEEASAQPADEAQTAEPTPEDSKPGNPGRRAHANAIRRLKEGQQKQPNRQQWATEYESETGIHPEATKTGEAELYRLKVWIPYKKQAKN